MKMININLPAKHEILDCQREGIFAEFVREHGTEAVNMLYTQFNMDDALDVRYKEGVEDGIAKGIAEERAIKYTL